MAAQSSEAEKSVSTRAILTLRWRFVERTIWIPPIHSVAGEFRGAGGGPAPA
jgi:hypothetical protein